MRVLIAMVIFAGGMLALNCSTADAARKGKRMAGTPYYYAAQPRHFQRAGSARARQACAYDRGGYFRGFPCWARKAFSEGRK